MDESQRWLADYVKNGSESAFQKLVARYVNAVYSTALRVVQGDVHLAEDVTQVVFVNLARKARVLPSGVILGGWLHRDTCFVAGTIMRGERRRRFRERQVVAMNALDDHTPENLASISSALDEAIAQMKPEERTAILLRFFDQLDFRAVGERLGSTEDAARMRVNRALDKLHGLLRKRGVTFSAVALGAALAAGFVSAAPAGLAATVSKTALASSTAGGIFAAPRQFMGVIKSKITVISGLAIIALVIFLAIQRDKLRGRNDLPQRQAAHATTPTVESQSVDPTNTGLPPNDQQVRELARLRARKAKVRQQSDNLERRKRVREFYAAQSAKGRIIHDATMAEFAKFIGGVIQAPVSDQTGLAGTFDFEMTPPRPGEVGKILERTRAILHNELGLQLAAFPGPFTTDETNFEKEFNIVRHADGSYTELGVHNFIPKPDGLYTQLPDGSVSKIASVSDAAKGGFAILLDHPNAPGLQPAMGELGARTGLYDAYTSGIPADVANWLKLIDAAKRQWAVANRKQNADTPSWQDIQPYVGCDALGSIAAVGIYTIGPVNRTTRFRPGPAAQAAWKSEAAGIPEPGTASGNSSATSQNTCLRNLRAIDAAKQEWALKNQKRNTDTPTMEELKSYAPLGGEQPICPDGGIYTVSSVSENPICSIPGHRLP